MKSVFALFLEYEDCEAAFDEMIREGFDQQGINVITKEEVAKTHMDIDLERVHVKATDELGSESTGLDIQLGTQQPVKLGEVGRVYAAGDMATIIAKAAAAHEEGLRETVPDFDVSAPAADAYVYGLVNDGILLWSRADDDRVSEVANILRENNGMRVSGYGG